MIRHKKLVTLKGQKVDNSREDILMALSHPLCHFEFILKLLTP